MNNEEQFKNVIAHAREYGFIFPSSEIYDGLGAVYDYGSYGAELKNNIRSYWWKAMIQLNDNIVGIDSAVFMHPLIWKASGHVDAFNDPLIDNKDSKKRYRADVLIEDHLAKLEHKVSGEVEKARKRFGEQFNEELYRKTNPRVTEIMNKIEVIYTSYKKALTENDLPGLKKIIMDCEIVCPVSGTKNWTDVRQFNLMFSTQLGSAGDDTTQLYLRPETAQGIFVNFLNVQKSARMKVPFGIAQAGKAFRNEIVARQFIFRMREFEQMEMQFFVKPGTEMEWYDYWKKKRMAWHLATGLPESFFGFKNHAKPAHYANAACDIEFNFPFGFKELEGIHSRTDFDLRNHEKYSGKKLQYFDPEPNSSYIPYVVETSLGLDRMFLALFSWSFITEKLEDGSTRDMLRLPPFLAPVKVAILPLVKKDGLPEKAMEIFNRLKFVTYCQYDEKDSIGKRYRRQDSIGTPLGITVDYQSLEDDTVTIRDRDTMKQERIKINVVESIVLKKIDIGEILKKL